MTLGHQSRHLTAFLRACDEVFPILVDAVAKNDIVKRLRGPVAHTGFRRLN